MSNSEKVDQLIREHLSLNEGLNANAPAGDAPNARVTEIRQELVQIFQASATHGVPAAGRSRGAICS
jgi:hypothetical protein